MNRFEIIKKALDEGKSWPQIATMTGMTKQGCWSFYHRKLEEKTKQTLYALSKILKIDVPRLQEVLAELGLGTNHPDTPKLVQEFLLTRRCLFCECVLPSGIFKYCDELCFLRSKKHKLSPPKSENQ